MRFETIFSLIFLITFITCYKDETSSGVIDKIKAGFELAGKILGLDQTSRLAQMVSQTFSAKHYKHHASDFEGNSNIFSGFLRLLGLDTKKLSAIAVNAIIFIAQLISSSLSTSLPPQVTAARKIKEGTPFEWLLASSAVANLTADVKDKNLPNNIVEYIKERGMDEDTGCIQLLMCKTAPFVWGMQKSLNSTSNEVPKGRKALFSNLPTIEEFSEHGDLCEEQHPYCLIYY